MDEHDLKKDGVISYYEFKALFLDLKDMEDAKNYELWRNNSFQLIFNFVQDAFAFARDEATDHFLGYVLGAIAKQML